MTAYSVYEPRDDSDLAERADRVAFVKEGFSWPALFVPALWLIFHRMWIELIVFVVIFSVLPWVFGWDRQGEQLFGWVSLALVTLFAFEANDLRGAALRRRGYQLAGIVTGRDRTQAEQSFFKAWLPQQARAARSAQRGPARSRDHDAPVVSGEGEEVIGLFPRP